ncbi:unnamed protein product [Dimorphilus gyrociliatus]|uniref:Uncharacterized protein n=1 Tax=Dimorphilus gyrociliatus TaxID=2664684 RepID=A0A7I8W250_9ANNE|nr:unnamed protein product [Dimorphilus gyrociliatus]
MQHDWSMKMELGDRYYDWNTFDNLRKELESTERMSFFLFCKITRHMKQSDKLIDKALFDIDRCQKGHEQDRIFHFVRKVVDAFNYLGHELHTRLSLTIGVRTTFVSSQNPAIDHQLSRETAEKQYFSPSTLAFNYISSLSLSIIAFFSSQKT